MSQSHSYRATSAAIALDAATAALLSFIDQLSESTSHQALPGGWTPAGHAGHVALTNDVFLSVLKGGAGCTGPITPFQGVSDYSDATWSMDAPPPATAPPILIPAADLNLRSATAHLRKSATELRAAIAELDPELALYCIRLPWAAVSVYQMCEWASGHTLRHMWQVNRELQIAAMRAGTQSENRLEAV